MQPGSKPTASLTPGQELKVVVLPSSNNKNRRIMLSCMPSAVASAENSTKNPNDVTPAQHTASEPAVGTEVVGVVDFIGKDSISVAISNNSCAHVYCLHTSDNPEAATALQKGFELGSIVRGTVIEAHERRTSLSLLPQDFAVLYRGSPAPKVRYFFTSPRLL